MNAVESIVNTYRAKCGFRYDKEVAESLDMTSAALSNYTKGKTRLPHIAIAKMSERTGIPALGVMAAVNVTYTGTPDEERAYWQEKLALLKETVLS